MAEVKMWQDRATRQRFIDQGQERLAQIQDGLRESRGIVAIEVESGDYFVGATLGQANDAARHRYLDHWLYFLRLDNPEAAIPLPVW